MALARSEKKLDIFSNRIYCCTLKTDLPRERSAKKKRSSFDRLWVSSGTGSGKPIT
jgi:hypothetical protein